jgi:uncharacterized membrane protein
LKNIIRKKQGEKIMKKKGSGPGHICQVCRSKKSSDLQPGILVRPALAEMIKKDIGSWSEDGWICSNDLQKYRHAYVQLLLEKDKGELDSLEKEVLDSMQKQDILSKNPDEDIDSTLTFGQRLADKIASVGGSWRFIGSFVFFLLIWILINAVLLTAKPFDPYPFILLNLLLSCLASIQAPVIMMSQNRQETRDRQHAMHDYQINLKAELEIRHLHQKIDYLLSRQWERLVEIQDIQLELINEIREKL